MSTSIIGTDPCGSFRHEVFVDDALDSPLDSTIFTSSLADVTKTLDVATTDFDKV